LSARIGFQFREEELSPELRRRVGEASALKQEIDSKSYTLAQKEPWVRTLRSRKSSQTAWGIALIVLGVVSLIVIIGVAFIIGGIILLLRRQKSERLIQERTRETYSPAQEASTLNATLVAKLPSLANDIFAALSASHQVRTAAIGSVNIVGSGPTVQLVKETIREVVMVPCA